MSDLSEEDIIKRIIQPFLDGHKLDKLDDAIAISLGDFQYVVLNVDTLVASTDVLPETKPEDVGWKVTVMTMSDIIAKGAKPIIFMNSITSDSDREIDYINKLIFGIRKACDAYGASFLGGDLNEANELTITGVGLGVSNRVVPRKGSRVGDSIWITGEFGYTGLAFHYLLSGGKPVDGIDEAIEVTKKPKVKMKSGEILSRIATASMDSSDGLAYTLNILAEANNLRFIITNLSIPDIVFEYAKENNINPLNLVFFGGEEFEIVFTTNLEDEEVVKAFRKETGFSPIKIGYVEKGEGVYFEGKRIEKKGWQHFRKP